MNFSKFLYSGVEFPYSYFASIHEAYPSKYVNGERFVSSCLDEFLKDFNILCREHWDDEDSVRMYIQPKNCNKSILLINNIDECFGVVTYYIGDKNPFTELYESFLKNHIYIYKSDSNGIQLIMQGSSGFYSQNYDLNSAKMDIDTQYNDDFKEVYEKLVTELSSDKRGFFILRGEPGTGKTSLIRHLTGVISEKPFLFFPPNMVDSLSSPAFIPFLLKNVGSILVIEEAEQVLVSREVGGGRSSATSNLLNITDGLLADILNIKIICTFNNDYNKVDSALLRKGRLSVDYEFKSLSVEKSNNLLKERGINHVTKVPMTLAQIYNFEETNEFSTKEQKKIGF